MAELVGNIKGPYGDDDLVPVPGLPGFYTIEPDDTAPTPPRVLLIASAATVTPTALYDLVKVTALAVNVSIANPTGAAVDGQRLTIRIKDNGTTRTISWGSNYRAVGVTLPTTTIANKMVYIEFIFDLAATKWDATQVRQEA